MNVELASLMMVYLDREIVGFAHYSEALLMWTVLLFQLFTIPA